MPAACSLSGRLSTRNASTTMSWVDDIGRDQQRTERHEQRRARRIGQREQQDRGDQQQLREHQPAAAAAEQRGEERHMQRVDQRRPDEFQRVGRADQREQPDGAEIDAGLAHPHQERRSRQRQRQPRRKAEHQHDQHARLQVDGRRLAPGRGGAAAAFSGEAAVIPVRSWRGVSRDSRSLPLSPCGRGWIE